MVTTRGSSRLSMQKEKSYFGLTHRFLQLKMKRANESRYEDDNYVIEFTSPKLINIYTLDKMLKKIENETYDPLI